MEKHLPFFVYGTLRKGQHNYEYYFKEKITKEFCGCAWIKGTLYDYGKLPAYKPEGNNWIKGDLLYVKENHYKEVLLDIDFLEGYQPSSEPTSLYLRRDKKVFLEPETWLSAWVYIFNYHVSERLMSEIKSGDWNNS